MKAESTKNEASTQRRAWIKPERKTLSAGSAENDLGSSGDSGGTQS